MRQETALTRTCLPHLIEASLLGKWLKPKIRLAESHVEMCCDESRFLQAVLEQLRLCVAGMNADDLDGQGVLQGCSDIDGWPHGLAQGEIVVGNYHCNNVVLDHNGDR